MSLNAYSMIRAGPVYRAEAVTAGLKAAGLNVCANVPRQFGPADVLVIWNRYGDMHALATRCEAGGGRVIVAENGYLGFDSITHRAHDRSDRRMLALSLHDHNGKGVTPAPPPVGPSRFAALGIRALPWRAEGGKILVCGQRGIGSPGRGSPPNWEFQTASEIRRHFPARDVDVRPHPGDKDPPLSLEAQLAGASGCVVWASGAGIKALVLGVPVFYACQWWIGAAGARRYLGPGALLSPMQNDVARAAALEAMAWGQWTVDEIAGGGPFTLLLALKYPGRAA